MWPFNKKPSYSNNLDILVALVTHLGYTDWNMRSTKGLAKAVGHTELEVSMEGAGGSGVTHQKDRGQGKVLLRARKSGFLASGKTTGKHLGFLCFLPFSKYQLCDVGAFRRTSHPSGSRPPEQPHRLATAR